MKIALIAILSPVLCCGLSLPFLSTAAAAGPLSAKATRKASAASDCRMPQQPQVLAQAEHELHQFWVLEDHDVYWRTRLPQSQSLHQFREKINQRFPVLEPGAYYATQPLKSDDEAYNKLLGASGRVGDLAPINCLEALLLSVQTERLPMLSQPSEFGAFVLRKKDKEAKYQYKIYFSTQDQPGLRMNGRVMALITEDRQQGWLVWAHLHNHNFFLNQPDPFASPSPSKTDVMFARMMYQSLDLQNLWITNGFHSLHISQREFYLFRDHNDVK